MKLYCRGSKECKQCSFLHNYECSNGKVKCADFFFSAVVQQCVFASTCLSRQAREIQGFCVAVFPDKQHLQPLQSRSFMLAHLRRVPVCVSSLYSFVSVRQSDCLTITALIKLSGDEKSSLQSVQKQANRCEFKHMSIRDVITVPLAEVGNVTVDSVRMNKSIYQHTQGPYYFHMYEKNQCKSIRGFTVFHNKFLDSHSWKMYKMGGYYSKQPHLTNSILSCVRGPIQEHSVREFQATPAAAHIKLFARADVTSL